MHPSSTSDFLARNRYFLARKGHFLARKYTENRRAEKSIEEESIAENSRAEPSAFSDWSDGSDGE